MTCPRPCYAYEHRQAKGCECSRKASRRAIGLPVDLPDDDERITTPEEMQGWTKAADALLALAILLAFLAYLSFTGTI